MDVTQMLNKIDIPIPDIVYSYDDDKKKEIYEYLSQIKNNEQQQKAYKIAFAHLGSSFNIYKSNGFKEWKNNRTK
jgi:hypothetical protein